MARKVQQKLTWKGDDPRGERMPSKRLRGGFRYLDHRGVGADRRATVRRTTVAGAADALGISAEAVRGRIRRGTLRVEREGGRVYVLLDAPDQNRTAADQPRTTDQPTADRTDLLIAELQDRVRHLEDANRENRRIIAALTSRIPELEAPSGERGSPEAVEEEPEGAEPRPTPAGPRTPPQRRSLWRRVFER